jgi:hypothetical protein
LEDLLSGTEERDGPERDYELSVPDEVTVVPSNSTQNLDQIRAMARQRGYSPDEIEQKLVAAGLTSAPEPTGFGGQLAHGAGVIGRSAVQGLGNMASMPFGLAGMAYQGMTGNQPPAMLQGNMGTNAANAMGLPQYQGAGERMLGAAGENAIGGALLPGGAAMGRMALGGAAGLAGQGAAEAGAGPMGQMAASAAAGMGLPVTGMILSGAIRSALAGSASRRAAAQETMALIQAGDPKAAVTLGQVAEGGAARTIEGGLKNIPGTGSVFQRTLDKQATEMGERVEKVASKMGPPAAKEVVGAAVQRGIEQGFIPNFKAKSAELYERVYSMVPPTSPVTPTATTRLMVKQNDLMGMAGELSDDITNPKFAKILGDLDKAAEAGGGTVPFEVIKELRSRLGAMLSGDELIADINLRDVKRLYGTLTEDMGAAVQKTGGTPATQAWNRANTFVKAGHERIDKILQPLVSKRTPEQAMSALMSGTKEGATALRSTLRSLDPASAGLVRSNVLRQLGRMPDETFSPELFLRKLDGLAPTAKAALFDGEEQVGTGLLSLAKTAEARKAAGKVMFNPSGTAQNTAFFAILNGMSKIGISGAGALVGQQVGGGLGAMAGAMGAPLLTAAAANQLAERVFTNPRMINWLVRQTKIPFGAMQQELAILAKDATKWGPEDKQTAMDLVGAMAKMDWRTVLLGQAAADATAQRR